MINRESRPGYNVAILLPTYDELPETIRLSILNLVLRMREVEQGINFALLIGVNGPQSNVGLEHFKLYLEAYEGLLKGVVVQVHKYTKAGKENAMNQLARAATSAFSGAPADLHIGTDVKVYRAPHSIASLITEFLPSYLSGENPRYLGGSVLPYPIEVYEKYHELNDERRLFYTLLEIDKHPDVLKHFPKTHLRGGLYITGAWEELLTDIPDDCSISRITRYQHGMNAIQITNKSVGYVIPRQSFVDYFAVRLQRSIPAEEYINKSYPEWAGLRDSIVSPEEIQRKQAMLESENPTVYALYQTKKELDKLCRHIALHMNKADQIIDEIRVQLSGMSIPVFESLDLKIVTSVAQISPRAAALAIVYFNKEIITSLAENPRVYSYGPRDPQYRGMLPLDEDMSKQSAIK